jgi:hypothetical protein
MSCLTLAFETEGLLGMIYKAMSNDWLAGLAHLVGSAAIQEVYFRQKDIESEAKINAEVSNYERF